MSGSSASETTTPALGASPVDKTGDSPEASHALPHHRRLLLGSMPVLVPDGSEVSPDSPVEILRQNIATADEILKSAAEDETALQIRFFLFSIVQTLLRQAIERHDAHESEVEGALETQEGVAELAKSPAEWRHQADIRHSHHYPGHQGYMHPHAKLDWAIYLPNIAGFFLQGGLLTQHGLERLRGNSEKTLSKTFMNVQDLIMTIASGIGIVFYGLGTTLPSYSTFGIVAGSPVAPILMTAAYIFKAVFDLFQVVVNAWAWLKAPKHSIEGVYAKYATIASLNNFILNSALAFCFIVTSLSATGTLSAFGFGFLLGSSAGIGFIAAAPYIAAAAVLIYTVYILYQAGPKIHASLKNWMSFKNRSWRGKCLRFLVFPLTASLRATCWLFKQTWFRKPLSFIGKFFSFVKKKVWDTPKNNALIKAIQKKLDDTKTPEDRRTVNMQTAAKSITDIKKAQAERGGKKINITELANAKQQLAGAEIDALIDAINYYEDKRSSKRAPLEELKNSLFAVRGQLIPALAEFRQIQLKHRDAISRTWYKQTSFLGVIFDRIHARIIDELTDITRLSKFLLIKGDNVSRFAYFREQVRIINRHQLLALKKDTPKHNAITESATLIDSLTDTLAVLAHQRPEELAEFDKAIDAVEKTILALLSNQEVTKVTLSEESRTTYCLKMMLIYTRTISAAYKAEMKPYHDLVAESAEAEEARERPSPEEVQQAEKDALSKAAKTLINKLRLKKPRPDVESPIVRLGAPAGIPGTPSRARPRDQLQRERPKKRRQSARPPH